MDDLVISMIPTIRRLTDLGEKSTDSAIRIFAKHLDLPMDDSETVDFLRQAMLSAAQEMRLDEAKRRVKRLENRDHD
jgi:hypothetical protein